MKKIFFIAFILIAGHLFADNNVKIEIHNVVINGGKVYVGVYFNETSYKNKRQDRIIEIEPTNGTITAEINLPEGEYVLDAYQDTNNNGICDLGLFNIPKEPVGITNWNGGIPGNFNRHKVQINNGTNNVIVNLIKF